MASGTASRASSAVFVLALVLFAGAIVRARYLSEIVAAPDFAHPAVDAGYHDAWARTIAFEDYELPAQLPDPEFEEHPYLRPPGYPYLLALVYKLTGGSFLAPRVLQMTLGMCSALLAFVIGRRFFGLTEGVLFAAGMALFGPFVYFEGELHAVAVLLPVLLAAYLALGRWMEEPSLRRALVAGLFLGLGALLRPNVLLLAPVAGLWCWVVAREKNLSGLRSAVVVVAATLLAVLPATLRNYRVAKELVLVSSNAGINLYIGNNPHATGLVSGEIEGLGPFDTCYDYPALVRALEKKLGHELDDAEVSRWFTHEALSWIRANPRAFLALTVKKLGLLLGPREVSHNKVLPLEREHSPVLRRLPWSFAFVLSSAVVGAVVLLRQKRAREMTLLALLFAGTLLVTVLPFFVASRYRVPAVPFLLLLGAAAGAGLVRFVRERDFERATVLLIAWFGADVLANANPLEPPVDVVKWHDDRGRAYRRSEQYGEALKEYRAAVAADARSWTAHFGLAQTLDALGEDDEAIEHYLAAAQCDPEDGDALNNAGTLYARRGDTDRAVMSFKQAVQRDPDLALGWANLGTALIGQGKPGEAAAALRRAVTLDPDLAHARRFLARALVALGEHAAAVRQYRRAIELEPDRPVHRAELARLLATSPDAKVRDGAEAVRLALSTVDGAGEARIDFLETLAAAYAETGDFESAIERQRSAMELAEARGQSARLARMARDLAGYEAGRPSRMGSN